MEPAQATPGGPSSARPDTVRSTRSGSVPWPAALASRYVEEGCWQGRDLGGVIAAAARRFPDAVAVVDGDVRLTHAQLGARADALAAALADLDVVPDDRVVVALPNCWEFLVVLLACLRAGVVPVLALHAHQQAELTGIASRVEARALVVAGGDRDRGGMALSVARSVPSLRHVLVAGPGPAGTTDLRTLCAPIAGPAADHRAPASRDVALFVLSGGTTGASKLVGRTHDDLAHMIDRASRICGIGPATTYLAALPLGHGFPTLGPGALGVLASGGRVVLCPSPAPEEAFARIRAEGVTFTAVVPAVLQRWMEHFGTADGSDLSSLRFVQVAGARLPDEVAERVAPVLGVALQQVFGMGEGLLCMTRLDDPPEVVCHTQGRPVSPADEIMVVDDDGRPVPDGTPGVLWTRGPYTTCGYYRGDAAAAASFVDGWYVTGDVVRRRPDGNLVVEGRVKDVINRGGQKITAEEVENLAHGLDGVRDAAAVAMPDPVLGERVCLCLVVAGDRRYDLDAVRAEMVRAGVAHFKLPERVVVLDAFPLSAVGKVDKVALRAAVAGRTAAEADSRHAA